VDIVGRGRRQISVASFLKSLLIFLVLFCYFSLFPRGQTFNVWFCPFYLVSCSHIRFLRRRSSTLMDKLNVDCVILIFSSCLEVVCKDITAMSARGPCSATPQCHNGANLFGMSHCFGALFYCRKVFLSKPLRRR
jgi:hypothetical protein